MRATVARTVDAAAATALAAAREAVAQLVRRFCSILSVPAACSPRVQEATVRFLVDLNDSLRAAVESPGVCESTDVCYLGVYARNRSSRVRSCSHESAERQLHSATAQFVQQAAVVRIVCDDLDNVRERPKMELYLMACAREPFVDDEAVPVLRSLLEAEFGELPQILSS